MRTLILFLLLISIRVIAQPIAWDAVATQNFIPHDPWRDIDGKQEYAKGDNWVQFVGTIIEVQPKGVRIRGYFFNPAPVSYLFPNDYPDGQIFFVANFPFQCAENEQFQIEKKLTAKEAGVYTYPTAIGGSATIRKLEYGTPCDPPADLVQARLKTITDAANAARELAQKKKAAADARTVQWLAPQATNGDASVQYSLAIHYLNGQGCETNRETAFFWLKKAAEQGSIDASNKLAHLEIQPNSQ